MAVIQLTGGSVECPAGAITIRLSRTDGLDLVLLGADGQEVEPNFRVTHTEVVIVPSQPVTVTARTRNGLPMGSGTRLGVSVKAADGSGDEVVRPASEVGGRQSVSLVEIAGGEIADLMGQATRIEQGWMQRGNYAYHVNHRQTDGRTTQWACVLDASASVHHSSHPEAYQAFLELILGIAATAYGRAPSHWVLSTSPPTDVTSALEGEEIDWDAALSHQPAPWPSLLASVEQATKGFDEDGAVVLVVDGVPVDYREVLAHVGARECVVVALGRSRFGARPEDRASQFWEEELEALDGFPRVVSVASLADIGENAHQIADAMYPGGER